MGVMGGGASTDIPRASHIGASARAGSVQSMAASTHDAQKNHLKAERAAMSGRGASSQDLGRATEEPHAPFPSIEKTSMREPLSLALSPLQQPARSRWFRRFP